MFRFLHRTEAAKNRRRTSISLFYLHTLYMCISYYMCRAKNLIVQVSAKVRSRKRKTFLRTTCNENIVKKAWKLIEIFLQFWGYLKHCMRPPAMKKHNYSFNNIDTSLQDFNWNQLWPDICLNFNSKWHTVRLVDSISSPFEFQQFQFSAWCDIDGVSSSDQTFLVRLSKGLKTLVRINGVAPFVK